MSKKLLTGLLLAQALWGSAASAETYVTIVQGLGGLPEYDDKFTAQRESIQETAHSVTAPERITALSGEEATRDALLAHFEEREQVMTGQDRAMIYLIGHGSFDGEEYKFNLPGPDITGADLARVLDTLPGENHFLLNTSSTSGALLESLGMMEAPEDEQESATSAAAGNPPRVIITATRNGNERNATEFGRFFVEALSSEEADLNKNSSISAREAFDYADRRTTAFYESEGKLATEHPQLRGDPAERLILARLNQQDSGSANPQVNTLLQRRQDIDGQIEELQLNRDQYSAAEYNRRLRELILESATVTEEIQALGEEDSSAQE